MSENAIPNVPGAPWLAVAAGEIGVKEVPGGGNHPRIIEYHQTCSMRATQDSVPWCSSFVNWCMRRAGYRGTDSAAAASWLAWGQPATDNDVGAVVVIRRRDALSTDYATGSASGNHVGFLVGCAKDGTGATIGIKLLGGNQSDQVKVSTFLLRSYAVRRVRWPRAIDRADHRIHGQTQRAA